MLPPTKPFLTITPNKADPVPTERYVRLLVVMVVLLLLLLFAYLFVRGLAMIHHTILLFALGGLLAYALDPVVEFVRGKPDVPEAPAFDETDGAENAPDSENAASLPVIKALPRRRARQRPRWLGVVTVFVTVALVIGVGTFLMGRQTIHQAQALVRDRMQIRENALRKLSEADDTLHARGINVNLADMLKRPPDSVKKWGEDAAKHSLNIASDITRSTVEGVVVLLISVYFLLFSEHLRGATTNLFPTHVQPYVSQWQDDVNRVLGGFIRGQAMLALVLGAAAAVVCAVLGLRFWLLIGAFVVLASLIPVIGPYIGTIPAIISAILTQHGMLSPGLRVAIVITLFVIINEFGSKVLYPKLVGKALGLHEIVVLFVLLAGLELGGIVGTLFAAPLTALMIVTVVQVYRMWIGAPVSSPAGEATAEGADDARTKGARS